MFLKETNRNNEHMIVKIPHARKIYSRICSHKKQRTSNSGNMKPLQNGWMDLTSH